MPAATCAFYMAVGKFLRYWLLLAGVELWLSY
jgi:membrane protein YqaA with SNARE-associated domain